jgi:hypothetical protein
MALSDDVGPGQQSMQAGAGVLRIGAPFVDFRECEEYQSVSSYF